MVSVYNMLTESFGTIQIVVCLEGGVEYGFYSFIKQNKGKRTEIFLYCRRFRDFTQHFFKKNAR